MHGSLCRLPEIQRGRYARRRTYALILQGRVWNVAAGWCRESRTGHHVVRAWCPPPPLQTGQRLHPCRLVGHLFGPCLDQFNASGNGFQNTADHIGPQQAAKAFRIGHLHGIGHDAKDRRTVRGFARGYDSGRRGPCFREHDLKPPDFRQRAAFSTGMHQAGQRSSASPPAGARPPAWRRLRR